MTKQQLTNEQLDNIISSFSELIVDRMDMKDLFSTFLPIMIISNIDR